MDPDGFLSFNIDTKSVHFRLFSELFHEIHLKEVYLNIVVVLSRFYVFFININT